MARKALKMPRPNPDGSKPKSNNPQKKKPSQPPVWEFVEVELTLEDKQALRDGWRPMDDFLDYQERLIDEGYKVSYSIDEKKSTVIYAVSGKNSPCKNIGRTMVGRGGSLEQAWLAFAYKFEHYCYDGVFPRDTQSFQEDFG